MEITLRILESFLQASRSYLSKHIQVAGTLITVAPLTSLGMIDVIVSVCVEVGNCTFERKSSLIDN